MQDLVTTQIPALRDFTKEIPVVQITARKSEEPKVNGYEVLGRVVAFLLFLPTLLSMVVLRGYTLHCLWGWFLTKLIPGPVPGIALCIGISLTISFLTHPNLVDKRVPSEEEKSREYTQWQRFLLGLVAYLLVLGVGWLIYTYALPYDN